MGTILALAGKDLRLLYRDKAGFFFVFIFPLLFAVFFGVIFSGGGGSSAIPIALVDQDSTAASRAFVDTLKQAAELDVLEAGLAEAADQVRRGKRAAYIVLKPGFGEAWGRVFWGDPAEVEVGLDPSRKAEAGMLQGVLTRYFMEGIQSSFSDPQKMRGNLQSGLEALQSAPDSEQTTWAPLRRSLEEMDRFFAQPEVAEDTAGTTDEFAGWQPLSVTVSDVAIERHGPKNPFEVSFPQAMIWAMLGCAATFGISLVVERAGGTLVRLQMAPLTRGRILAGKGLACFAAVVGVTLMLLVIAMLVFRVRPGSPGLLALAVASAALCYVGLMMFLSVLGRTEASASGIGWAVLLVLAMIGGGMVPLFIMPSWMQSLATFSPVRWTILALEGAIWRGFDLGLMLQHCAVLAGFGAVGFAIGVRAFRW
ncbi:MAG: ABC transporter permease [Candidatus Zixiibacteriota bacterium]|nr:MAG: ABC transporter permease [candidate division Zixibacteria bacterium]